MISKAISTATKEDSTSESQVKKVWEEHWDHLGFSIPDRETNSYHVFRELKRFLPSLNDLKILEAGSGTGNTSLELWRCGAKVTLLDITRQALEIGREGFAKGGGKTHFIQGSVFSIPAKEESYDIVFNSGLLEHFESDLQGKALLEMVRVCKSGGWVISMNGYAKSVFYRLGKFALEKTGRWTYGKETPVESLAPFAQGRLEFVGEHDFGLNGILIEGFKLIKMEPATKFLRRIYFAVPEPVTKAVDRLLSAVFGGYIIMSVFKKTA